MSEEKKEVWVGFFNICKIEDLDLITQIGQACSYDLDVFCKNYKQWNSDYQLNEEQVKKIFNIKRLTETALVHLDDLVKVEEIFPDQQVNLEVYKRFLESSKIVIDDQIANWALNCKRTSMTLSTSVHNTANTTLNLVSIVNGLINFSKNHPSLVLSFSDELIDLIKNLELEDIARNNIYASGIIFGLVTVFSVGKRLKECFDIRKQGKKVDWIENFLKPIGVDLVSNVSFALLTGIGGFAGAFISSCLIPFFGPFIVLIGSAAGSLAGGWLSKSLIEPFIRNKSTVEVMDVLKSVNEEELYTKACQRLNVPKEIQEKQLKQIRRQNLINWHPDKNPELDNEKKEEYTQHLIECELFYTVIKEKRGFH
jgi:hypothetical protein